MKQTRTAIAYVFSNNPRREIYPTICNMITKSSIVKVETLIKHEVWWQVTEKLVYQIIINYETN
jgi:isopenicillin N synthase-like dioxygenase